MLLRKCLYLLLSCNKCYKGCAKVVSNLYLIEFMGYLFLAMIHLNGIGVTLYSSVVPKTIKWLNGTFVGHLKNLDE